MRGLIGCLLLVGVAMVYWQWILTTVIVVLILKVAPVAYRELQAERVVERQRLQALIARADKQHAQVMAGNERGVCGDHPPLC